MKKTIFNLILTIISLILLVIDLFFKQYHLIVFTAFLLLFVVIYWYYILYRYFQNKRINIYENRIEKLDRLNPKFKSLFIIYDYIKGNENNMDVVTEALKEVYFYSSYMIRFPLQFKRKAYYNGLIEYYKSITKDKIKSNFIFDFNKNYFTWKFVFILLLFGVMGISLLIFINDIVVDDLSILNTFLYVIFGLFTIPFIIKVYDHLF